MEKQHLTYFKIENFKRFDSFEMSNLGQFNLIVGDNNVGKTSVLEGLLFDKNLKVLLGYYFMTMAFRHFFGNNGTIDKIKIQESEFWNYIFKDFSKPIFIEFNNEKLILENKRYEELNNQEVFFAKKYIVNEIPKNWFSLKNGDAVQIAPAYFDGLINDYIPFIPADLTYGTDLVNFYYNHYNLDKELRRELEKNIKEYIPNFEEIRIHKFFDKHEVLCFSLSDRNTLMPLTSFGDGTIKITRILFEILINKGGRVMIDEIGNGIHFTKLKQFWKRIISVCSQNRIQLFATTHSLECQQAFIEALQDDYMKQFQADARNISMIEDKGGNVKSVTYNFDQFEYAMNIGFNTRGGKL
jgi:AAA15 family ATPase/GTPase